MYYNLSCFADPDSDRLCPEILPATTSPAVKDFYSALQRGEIDDISTLQAPRAAARAPPSDRAVNTGKQEKHKNHGKNPITRSGNEQIATGVPSAAAGGNIAAEIIVPDVAAAEHATKRANDSAVDGRVEKGSLGGGDSGAQQQQAQYWEATTAGRAWFHLCSELPGSDYLSSTSSASGNRQYELQPNMRNVCATVCALLGVAENAGASGASGASADSPSIVASALITSTTSTISSASWRLKDLETYWNQHCEHLHLPHRKIATTEGTVRFRAPFSDTETINREVGTIQFVQGQRSAIDIELESNHQLATVKHRLCVDPAMRLWNAKNRDLFAQFWQTLVGKDAKSCSLGGSCFSFADSSFVVASAVLNDNMIETLLTALQMQRPEQQPQSAENTKEDHVDSLVVQALLSCRWGEERRQVTDSTDPNSSSTLSVTDASLTTADAQRQQQQSIRMTVSALKLLAYVKDERILASLVRWILQEAPNEVGIESLAAALLHLPHNVRLDKKFHSVLATIYEAQQAALIQQMVLVGTEQCPAQSLFRKCDLPWRKMMTLVKFCIQNKLSVFKV